MKIPYRNSSEESRVGDEAIRSHKEPSEKGLRQINLAPTPIVHFFLTGASEARNEYALPKRSATGLNTLIHALVVLCTGCALVVLWYVLAELEIANRIFFPHPEMVAKALLELFAPPPDHFYWGQLSFRDHYVNSLFRLSTGLVVGTALGVVMGVLAARYVVCGMLFTWLVFLPWNNLPRLVYVSLLVLAGGFGHAPVVVSVVTVVFLTVSAILYNRLAYETKQGHIDAAAALGLRPALILWKVTLPLAVPSILTAVQISIGRGIGVLVLTEWIASSNGIGYLMNIMKENIATDILWALGIVTLLTVAVLFVGIALLRRLLTQHE